MANKHSKFLSLILRHDPSVVGITLDSAGWTDVAALLAACAAKGTSITRAELAAIVRDSDKQRFALSDDGLRIRANQGHSVPVELGLPRVDPPAQLFHGTVTAALPEIRAKGIEKRARHHVHMSEVVATATTVGMRRGAPVLLTIRAAEMAAAGHAFYRSENGVWARGQRAARVHRLPARAPARRRHRRSRREGEDREGDARGLRRGRVRQRAWRDARPRGRDRGGARGQRRARDRAGDRAGHACDGDQRGRRVDARRDRAPRRWLLRAQLRVREAPGRWLPRRRAGAGGGRSRARAASIRAWSRMRRCTRGRRRTTTRCTWT